VVAVLKQQVLELSQQSRDASHGAVRQQGEEVRQAVAGKQTVNSLARTLAKLLNEMKGAVLPEARAPLDQSAATPSAAMGALQVLIKGLGLKVPDVTALADPSPEVGGSFAQLMPSACGPLAQRMSFVLYPAVAQVMLMRFLAYMLTIVQLARAPFRTT
jgi:hypothetical protein